MHRIFSGNGWLVIPGIRKPAPDYRPSRLLVQLPLVLLILYILCIHVHKKIDSRRRPSPPPHQPSLSGSAVHFPTRDLQG